MASETELAIKVKAIVDDAITKLGQVKTGVSELGNVADDTTRRLKVHEAGVDSLAGALNNVGHHYRMVSAGAEVLGAEASAAGAKIAALTDVLEGLGSAAPMLLVIAAAFEVVFKSFEFFKDGIDAAGEMQAQLETLGAAVEAQGGSWGKARAAIMDFVKSESIASGFTQNELLSALNELITAGTSVADSMTITAIAEETAIAHHMSLLEVTRMLIEAESGRGQGLARLDPRIKALIHSHADLKTVLEELHRVNQKQIEDGDSLERSQARAKAASEAFAEAIGARVLPLMTEWNYGFIGLLAEAEDFGKGIGDAFNGVVQVLKGAGQAFVDFARVAGAAMRGDMAGALLAWQSLKADGGTIGKGLSLNLKGIKEQWAAIFEDEKGRGHRIADEAAKKHKARTDHIALENNPELGFPTTKHPKHAKHHALPHAATTPENEYLKDLLYAIGISESQLKSGEKSSIAGLENKRESVRHALAMADAHGAATPEMKSQAAAQEAAITAQIAKIKEETAARDVLLARLEDSNAHSEASRRKLTTAEDALTQAHVEVTKTANLAAEAFAKIPPHISGLAKTLDTVVTNLASKVPGLTAQEKPGGGISLGFNWATFLIQAVSQTKAFGDIMKTVTEIMRVVAQIFDALRPVIDLFLRGVILVANGFITLWNVIAHILRLFGIHVKLLDKINADFSELHQNAVPLINIVHDIPTMNELASGKIAPLYPAGAHDQQINSFTRPITDGLKDPGMGGGLLGGILQVVAGIEGMKLLLKMFGLGSGGGGMLGHLFGGNGISGLLGKLGLHFGSGTNGTALLGTLGVLAGAAGLGSLVGKMEGGGSHATWGAVGGVAGAVGAGALFSGMGGMAGLMAAGPAGWAVLAGGALLGAITGGLFGGGGHKGPDQTDTQNWGQGLANLQGSGADGSAPMNANGQQFVMNSQMAQALGNQGELGFIGNFIAQHPDEAKKILSSDQLRIFTGVNDRSIYDDKGGNLSLRNGQRVWWQDLISTANDAITKIGQSFNNMSNSVGQNLNGVAGNITRYIDASTNDLAGSPSQQQSGSNIGGGEKRRSPNDGNPLMQDALVTPGQGDTHVHIHGDVHGYNDILKIGTDLAEILARKARIYQHGVHRVPGHMA